MVHQKRIDLSTTGHGDMHDVTKAVSDVISGSRMKAGIVNVSVIGSTGAIGTIEFEEGLRGDLPGILDQLMPPGRHYGHEQAWHDGNAHSHLQATVVGPSLTIPFGEDGPILGTWQQVFFLECDVRARERTLVVTVLGER